MPPTEPPAKRRPGRPRVDASGPQVRRAVKLAPAEADHLTARYGTVNEGLRTLVRRDMDALRPDRSCGPE